MPNSYASGSDYYCIIMNALLVRRTVPTKNIGDYIQSLAQLQFWGETDCFVDCEQINTVSERVNLIMNGWWMWHPENFPPSEFVNPLFISFHINGAFGKRLLNEKAIDYLKKYEPIGARDLDTVELLETAGIKAYYSGCLTLTLDLSFKTDESNNRIVFVDPEYSYPRGRNFIGWIRSFAITILYIKSANKLYNSFCVDKQTAFSRISMSLNKLMCAALFYHDYSPYFEDSVLFTADYVSHIVDSQKVYTTHESCLLYARKLLELYARAKLVVTSRVHAALPCISFDTPVIFVDAEPIDFGSKKGRLGGTFELFNYTMKIQKRRLFPYSNELKTLLENQKISYNSVLSPSQRHLSLRDNLISSVKAFVKKCRESD